MDLLIFLLTAISIGIILLILYVVGFVFKNMVIPLIVVVILAYFITKFII